MANKHDLVQAQLKGDPSHVFDFSSYREAIGEWMNVK